MRKDFFNDTVQFETTGGIVILEDIVHEIPQDFNGKQDFIDFYLIHNGVFFPQEVNIDRSKSYDTALNDYKLLSIEFFYSIKNKESEDINSISDIWDAVKENTSLRKFAKKSFPFAADAGGNNFWIELSSGIIWYIRCDGVDTNPVKVAPSFLSFCQEITPLIY